MCGIAGILATDGSSVEVKLLEAMVDVLVHRGPDERGIATAGPSGLAMQRLSIIGVSNGRQPIESEDRQKSLVLNGEIYNHLELKSQLRGRGHDFRTDSDAEVALHLYEEVGLDFVQELRGMFALALFDKPRERLVLARDRTGQKPLYYTQQGHQLAFASEIKAIHAAEIVSKELNEGALHCYLTLGFVAGDQTLFRHVKRLPPGHILCAERGEIFLHRYWDLPQPAVSNVTLEVASSEIRHLVEEAVEVRLMSEVPLGAFLSGGVDSSLIVGLMAGTIRSPIQTFAVGFGDSTDELPFARIVAQKFNTVHHEVNVLRCEPELLQVINWHFDEPASDPAAVPTFCLSRYASHHITVALTGEGGDEAFAGYRHYVNLVRLGQIENYLDFHPALSDALRRIPRLIEPLCRGSARKALWLTSLQPQERLRGWVSPFTDRELDSLLDRNVDRQCTDELIAAAIGGWSHPIDPLSQLLYFDIKTTLADQLLMKVDKMTMASSLEARSPMLDHPLIEYVARLAPELKISGRKTKLVLRKAFEDLLPSEILNRRKRGFDVPLARWLSQDLRGLVHSLLLSNRSPLSPYVEIRRLRRLWSRFERGRSVHLARQLWRLLNLAIWMEANWPARERTDVSVSHRERQDLQAAGMAVEILDFSKRKAKIEA